MHKSRELRMVKRMFSVSQPDFKWLREEAEDLGISVSELVRRAISEKRRRSSRAR